MGNEIIYYSVAAGCFLVGLLFCHAYEISNSYLYYPLAAYMGYSISMKGIAYVAPTAWEDAPPPPPKNRQEKKKRAKEAEFEAKRAEKVSRREADALRKNAEARERD
ncbi:hypothetical protein BGX29_006400 [Mortierella sp. GBA35]|nr:hypothetical protein BGX23_004897 [Mortierella sp. AD031]KAF9100638.1 hypothetical protein BGX29_006400 [Mortierella sp. GBA35]KAG0205986.1 hypothetical protein BGX33_007628 [Mortierella sp. NVP41]